MELLDTRVLGAVRFVDAATSNLVTDGLTVQSAQADLRRNRSGLWIVWNAAGLEEHIFQFDQPPAIPAVGSIAVSLTISDAGGRYLARAAAIHLPRDPDSTKADQSESLFQAMPIALYPSPNAPVSPGWAVIRAHVKNNTTGDPLGGALLRVLRTSDNQVLARGMSDGRGEALVVVPGIPVTTFSTGNGSPLATEIDVLIEAIFDAAAGAIPDPDSIEGKNGLPTASSPQKLAAGRELIVELAIAVPYTMPSKRTLRRIQRA
jgi:hypothetical protein